MGFLVCDHGSYACACGPARVGRLQRNRERVCLSLFVCFISPDSLYRSELELAADPDWVVARDDLEFFFGLPPPPLVNVTVDAF